MRGSFVAAAVCLLSLVAQGCVTTKPPRAPQSTGIAPPTSLQQLSQDITSVTTRTGVRSGVWAVVVHSLDRQERLFELNPRTLLVPASVAKLVSVATAAQAVGWDYRYETTVQGTTRIEDGVLHGDLLIVGSGDPSIGGRGGDDLSAWIDALKAMGLRRIDGRVIGDDDALEEPRPALSWAWDDLGYRTGALFGALNLAENRMGVTVTAADSVGQPTSLTVDPDALNRPLLNRSVTGAPGSSQLLWPEQRPGEPFLTIAGSIPAGAGPARLLVSVGNPTLWFASVFRNRLIASGIAVSGDAYDIDDVVPPPNRSAASVFYTHRSHPLSEIARPLLKESINLYGEAMLRLNARKGVLPTNDAALEGLRERLAAWEVPHDGEQLVDGSGLSRRDVITAETVLMILQRMHNADTSSPWMAGLPVAGVDGSLDDRLKGTVAEGNVRAKTGTMSNVRSLAGYVTTRDGERLAFVIMVNNFEGSGAAANQAIDAIAVRLAEFSRR